MITASWKKGMEGLFHADPQKVAEEILSIGESAMAEQIVEKAADAGTELHKCFTWDDTEAAKKWRLHEARKVVCHLVIKEVEPETKRPEVRFFFKAEKSEGYVPATTVFRNEDRYLALLQNALSELRAFQRKYKFLSDRQEIAKLINSLELMIADQAG